MNKTYRAVIIGDSERGAFGHHLDRAFCRVPNVEVVGIADPIEQGLQKGIERSKAQRGYADYRQMLAKERPELAVIAQRFCDQRKEIVLACVEAGVKGIYLEKPVAASVADADAMVEACDRAGVRAVVDHWRAGGDVRKTSELIASGLIGQVQIIRGHGKNDARSGGVDLMLLGTHVLDAMRHLAGAEVAWVHGHVTKDGRDVTHADAFDGPEGMPRTAGNGLTAKFSFQNGVIGTYESIPTSKDQDQVMPPGSNYFGFEVCGTRGILSLRYRSLHHYPRGQWMAGDEFGKWEKIPLGEWGRMDIETYYTRCHEVCVNELLRAIEEDRAPRGVSTLHDGRVVTEMIIAVHQSHLSGKRIPLPLTNRTNPHDVAK
jgi:predicted dehydrogenase